MAMQDPHKWFKMDLLLFMMNKLKTMGKVYKHKELHVLKSQKLEEF